LRRLGVQRAAGAWVTGSHSSMTDIAAGHVSNNTHIGTTALTEQK